MIQRVQSVYLLLITVLMSFLLVKGYADLTLINGHKLIFRTHAILSQSGQDTVSVYQSTIPILILVLTISLLSFCTIFFYKHRIIQIRLSMVNALLIFITIILMFGYYITTKNSNTVMQHSFRLPMIFPIMSIIFCLLAIRAIQRDEILVNSYNRLR